MTRLSKPTFYKLIAKTPSRVRFASAIQSGLVAI